MVRGLALTCVFMHAVSCGGSATSSGGDGTGGAGSSGAGANNGGSATGGSQAGASAASGSAGEAGETSTGGTSTGGTSTGGASTGGTSTGGTSTGGAGMGGAGMGGTNTGGASGIGGAGSGSGGAGGAGGTPGGAGGGAGAGGATPDPNVTYRACPTVGGITRLTLFKHDTRRGLCFTVTLGQGTAQTFPATAPEGWNVDRGMASRVTAACPETGTTFQSAIAITGSVTWQRGATEIPENIDADLVLEFPVRMEFPQNEPFQTNDLDADCI